MRYFKYKNTNKNMNIALKEQYKTLTEDEKCAVRKEKRRRKLCEIVGTGLFLLFFIVGFEMILLIPMPKGVLGEVLVIIGKIILTLLLLFFDGLLTFILTSPFQKKLTPVHLPSMKKEIFSKACGYLRDYYGVRQPYIVTKCFDSTNEIFKNHDVCVFVFKDELRITADLVSGFLHGERDLGCYVFKRDEIILSKHREGNRSIAELKADHTVFLLGYRAKGFIEKNFIEKESK